MERWELGIDEAIRMIAPDVASNQGSQWGDPVCVSVHA